MKKKLLIVIAIVLVISYLVARSGVFQIDQEACTSCGICLPVCPENAIEFNFATFEYEINPEACTACGICFDTCNNGAIYYATSGEDVEVTPLEDVKIYPNPAKDKFRISLTDESKKSSLGKVALYNTKGQKIKDLGLIETRSLEVDLAKLKIELTSGIYFLQISNEKSMGFKKVNIIK